MNFFHKIQNFRQNSDFSQPVAGVDTTYRHRSERPSSRAEERPRPLGKTTRKRKCRDGQAERNWKKKSCGVTTPRPLPGNRNDEKHSENAKERKSLKKASETRRIAPSGPTQILPAVQVARRRPRDLAGLWGQGVPQKVVETCATAARWVAASRKSDPPPRPPRAARKAILGR